MLQGSLFGSVIRPGICQQSSRVGSVSGRHFHAFSQIPTKTGAFPGLIKSPKIETHLPLSILGNLGMKLGLIRAIENVRFPCALSFRSFLHSGGKLEVDAGKNPGTTDYEQATQESGNVVNGEPPLKVGEGRNLRSVGYDQLLNRERGNGGKGLPPFDVVVGRNTGSFSYDQLLNRERGNGVNGIPPPENEAGRIPISMDYYRGLLRGSGVNGRPPHYQQEAESGRMPRRIDDGQGAFQGRRYGPVGGGSDFYDQPQLEVNADIVHIKLMRNNSYVTLTDDKGNRKISVSAGQVAAKGDKPGRYSGEAAAEYMGRMVKQMKIKSVVVKVSGFTFFRRKKDAILAFKDGYTHSRGDVNPVVYIEDTTRKPHNGCRLPKKRRI